MAEIISKIHHDYYQTVSGVYLPVASASMAKWPSSPVTRIRKASSYEPKADWRTLVNSHENATTNRQVNVFDYKIKSDFRFGAVGALSPNGTPFPIKMVGLPWDNTFPGTVSPATVHNTSNLTHAKAYATTKFLASIHESSVAVSGGVFVGELAETIRMLRSPMESLRHGYQTYIQNVEYRAIKAKIGGINKKRKSAILNDIITNTWLEAQLGLVPLFHDIKGLIEAVRDLDLRNNITQVSAMHFEDIATAGYYTRRMNDIDLSYNMTKKTTVKVYSKCGLLPHVTDTLGALGFRGFEFVPTIYNLIPYSFVVDYFTNLNSLLTAAITIRDRITYSSISTVLETSSDLFVKDLGTQNGRVYKFARDPSQYRKGHYQWLMKDIDRSDKIPPLELVFHVPRMKQIITVGALISSSQRTSYKLRGM